MAAERYPSRYGALAPLTATQWLAEHMCALDARRAGQDLPHRFWLASPVWEKRYALHAKAAAALLKLYPLAAVGRALRSKEGRGVQSLRANWFGDLVRAEARKLELEATARAAAPPPPPPPAPLPSGTGSYRPPFVRRPSLLSKLEDA